MLVCGMACVAHNPPGDMALVESRLLTRLAGTSSPGAAARALSSVAKDGCWPDVNYSDTSATGGWSPALHLNRTLALAIAVRWSNMTIPAAAATAAVHNALLCWFKRQPQSSNWWWDELQVPARIANIALVFAPHLTTEEARVMLVQMERV